MARAGPVDHARLRHRAHPLDGERVRARRRSAEARSLALRRRAPARRDRTRPADRAPALDPRRAHVGAHPAGGAEALRDLAEALRRRLLDPLHQPQARRDPGPLPSLHGATRRTRDRRGRPAQRDEREPLAPHDRRRTGAPFTHAGEAWGGRPHGQRTASAQARPVRSDARGHPARRARAEKSWASRACRATGSPS